MARKASSKPSTSKDSTATIFRREFQPDLIAQV